MATPVGTIGLSDVNAELNLSPTALITMNDAAVRTLAGVGGAGTVISMNDLRGKSNRVAISLTISTNTNNFDVFSNRGPTYSPGTSDLTVTINPGVTVSSSSTGSPAFVVPSAFNPADTVTIINNGTIVGRGGNGGPGGPGGGGQNNPPGGSGGPGLNVLRPTTVQNFNRIAGGGGGGGGGSGRSAPDGGEGEFVFGGGGGGGGVASGSGGSGGTGDGVPAPGAGSAGSTAPLSAGGSGGSGGSGAGPGGTGGAFGSSGTIGSNAQASSRNNRKPGGASGAAVTGNPFITYNPTGTRNGPVS